MAQYTNYISKIIVYRHSVTNDRTFVIENSRTEQLKHSFFVKTVVEWNHLDTEVVRAETVESFKEALTRCYWTTPLSPSLRWINAVTSPTPDTEEAEDIRRSTDLPTCRTTDNMPCYKKNVKGPFLIIPDKILFHSVVIRAKPPS